MYCNTTRFQTRGPQVHKGMFLLFLHGEFFLFDFDEFFKKISHQKNVCSLFLCKYYLY
jgi:hypothetical protein